MSEKWKCNECGHHFVQDNFLVATNPFNNKETIYGCPECKTVDQFTNICDEDGCKSDATCGWPSNPAYRRTCHKHMSKESEGDQS